MHFSLTVAAIVISLFRLCCLPFGQICRTFSELFEQRLPGNKWISSRQDLGKSRESIQVLPKTPRRTFSLPNRLLAGGNNWCLPPHSPNREIKPYVRRCQKTVELQLRR
ncbi:hypothetical protein B0I72DRAFT_33376 [Yarrowia lipolytica]|uniref:Secreted protein n=1 Tax=Yarrowia lipolytica TaxID=4952 RepID=A0A371C7B7_YARLL|nr:hypothetical protein BKA91DRAFT_30536 [Yarrowia lipolytica]KAE8171846.1 hypothetical protein BKA90DRAFT_23377 [Yarrowia lipolytica]RDW26193.1 hypothetical protein B0I71DRAFT_33692 [Yarrowia lipolytica]RDW32944.1 hypothetical protein B0I72DRAFT_33376 [Yarrowia lipolytica]RDW41855.1 hypothetical protein B0I73DRAFT_44809 [Yarrowia lipolytica]